MSDFKEKYGPWAIVSGASAGLGEEFARQLAARGLNVVLIARREDRLKALAADIENAHGVESRTIAVDLGTENFMDTITPAIEDLDVGLLINNAGFTNSGDFLDNPLDKELQLLHVNCRAAMVLAHCIGTRLKARGRGGIIFSASIAGFAAIPIWANYSASKSYDLLLAEALSQELKPHGVDVIGLCPGATRTEFEEYSGLFANLMVMDAPPVVAQALNKLGRRTSTVAGILNALTVFLYRFMPRRWTSWLAGFVIRDMVSSSKH